MIELEEKNIKYVNKRITENVIYTFSLLSVSESRRIDGDLVLELASRTHLNIYHRPSPLNLSLYIRECIAET